MERGRLWIVLKCAVSADGFIDPPRREGERGNLTPVAPTTHHWRAEEGAILVGAGTVGTDDPALSVGTAGPNPLRIVLALRNARRQTIRSMQMVTPRWWWVGPRTAGHALDAAAWDALPLMWRT